MKQEDRQEILLQQLSARMPYGLLLHCELNDGTKIWEKARLISVNAVKKEITVTNIFNAFPTVIRLDLCLVRPYLRRMMSMTINEEHEYDAVFPNDTFFNPMGIGKIVKWFHKNKFDFENLIESGIAIDAKDLYDEVDSIDRLINRLDNKMKEEETKHHKFSKSERKQIRENPVSVKTGDKVIKLSGKPFKSGQYVNTVKEIVRHPYKNDKVTGEPVDAYTFYEDDSIVEANVCTLAEKTMSPSDIINVLKENTTFELKSNNGFYGYGSLRPSGRADILEKLPWTKTVSNPRNPQPSEYPFKDGDYITMLDCDGHAVMVNSYKDGMWMYYNRTHVKWWMPLSMIKD